MEKEKSNFGVTVHNKLKKNCTAPKGFPTQVFTQHPQSFQYVRLFPEPTKASDDAGADGAVADDVGASHENGGSGAAVAADAAGHEDGGGTAAAADAARNDGFQEVQPRRRRRRGAARDEN